MEPVVIGDATLYLGDCIETMAGMEANSVDAIVTDPPYLLSFMGKAFDRQHKALAGDNEGQQMQAWHSAWVKEAYRVLKPGGYLLAFGGSRTVHRLMSALEDAGFWLHPILGYVFGAGFPKATNLSKQFDKDLGLEREVVGKAAGMGKQNPEWNGTSQGRAENSFKSEYEITAPASPEAAQWEGWFYGRQSLKPSCEPIAAVQKPFKSLPIQVIMDTENLIGALLCQTLTPASIAEILLYLSTNAMTGYSVSALLIAFVNHSRKQGDSLEKTVTFKSPEMAKTILNIVGSWNRILEEACEPMNTSTIKTITEATTVLRTLKLLIFPIIQDFIAEEKIARLGQSFNATIAEKNLNGLNALCKSIETFVQEFVMLPAQQNDALTVEKALMLAAASVSTVLESVMQIFVKTKHPLMEPIAMAQKPPEGRMVDNVRKWGTGAVNVGACRVAINPDIDDPRLGGKGSWDTKSAAKNVYEGGYAGDRITSSEFGRWPPHLLLDGSEEVKALFPETSSGVLKAGTKRTTGGGYHGGFPEIATHYDTGGDSGSAARFFPHLGYSEHDLDIPPIHYCAKASKRDRDQGCEGMEEKSSSSMPGRRDPDNASWNTGNDVTDRFVTNRRNNHPTCKPVSLMQWLLKLCLPPSGVVLDPFMGSGSTLKAACLENMRCIGIEMDEDYFEIACARVAHVSPESVMVKPHSKPAVNAPAQGSLL